MKLESMKFSLQRIEEPFRFLLMALRTPVLNNRPAESTRCIYAYAMEKRENRYTDYSNIRGLYLQKEVDPLLAARERTARSRAPRCALNESLLACMEVIQVTLTPKQDTAWTKRGTLL